MEEKKNYRAIFRQKKDEIHTSKEILQAFDNSFCACFALAEDRDPGAKARLFGMIWDIHPETIIVEADLFVVQSEPVAAKAQWLVISKNGTSEINNLLAQCIEESGAITSPWYIRSQKQGGIKTCYRHVLGSDKTAVLHKANLLLDGDDLLLSIRHLSRADHAQIKAEENADFHRYLGDDPVVIVPKGIEAIKRGAFHYNETIKSVILPASIKYIEAFSFEDCINLETADLSSCDSLRAIGENLFKGCKRLACVEMPKQVNKKYNLNISDGCFADCTSLQTIELPNGTVKIDMFAFSNCTSLTHLKLPESLRVIDQWVFSNCSALTHIDLPDSITFIGACTFQKCTSLSEVKLPSGIKMICSCLFEGCTSLTDITIPDGVERIVLEAFKDCSSLSEVKIPNSVTDIDENAFLGCKSLSHIYIPDSVEEIGEKAFSGCAKGFVLQSSNPKWKAYALKERLKFELIDDPYAK